MFRLHGKLSDGAAKVFNNINSFVHSIILTTPISLALTFYPNTVKADDYRDYEKGEVDLRIEACSDIIYNETKRYFGRALSDREFAIIYKNRGNSYRLKGLYHKAINDFDKAIRLDPNSTYIYYVRGMVYGRLGKYDRVLMDSNKILNLNPDYVDGYILRGVAYYLKGKFNKAISNFDKAIRLSPKLAQTYYQRGLVFSAKRQNNKAIADFNKSIRLNDKNFWFYFHRGDSYYRIGRNNRAIRDYNYAIKLNPNHWESYTLRGDVYAKKGRYRKARSDYRKALELRPHDRKINRKLAAIESKFVPETTIRPESPNPIKNANLLLQTAAQAGNLEVVKELIGAGLNTDAADRALRWTALMHATVAGHLKIVTFLLENSANPNAHSSKGETALLFAVSMDHSKIAEQLIKSGADVAARDKKGNTPLVAAIVQGNHEMVRILVDAGADPNFRGRNGVTPLVIALLGKRNDIVETLVDFGANVNTVTSDGVTPLMIAAGQRHPQSRHNVELFLLNGASLDKKNSKGATALDIARQSGSAEVQKYLQAFSDKPDENFEQMPSAPALIGLILKGKSELARKLIKKSEIDLEKSDANGWIPLTAAARVGDIKTAKALLRAGHDVDAFGSGGRTALHIAIVSKKINMVKLLLDAGANTKSKLPSGAGPLMLSFTLELNPATEKIFKLILAKKTDDDPELRALYRELQVRLKSKEIGRFYTGALTGELDFNTRAAILEFEMDRNKDSKVINGHAGEYAVERAKTYGKMNLSLSLIKMIRGGEQTTPVSTNPVRTNIGSASSFWNHNGSLMYLVADGKKRQFYYQTPRAALIGSGWKQGDLLFDGKKNGNTYSGTARLNSQNCGIINYKVSGTVQNNYNRVVLTGKAPRRDKKTCQTTGYRNDRLVFDYRSKSND